MKSTTNLQCLGLFEPSHLPHPLQRLRRFLWYVFARWIVACYVPGTCWRKAILRLFGAKIGLGGRIKPRVHVTCPWNLTVGNYCWIGEKVWIDNLSDVSLGENVCLSQGVYLCTGNHNYRKSTFDLCSAPIIIHSQAWIAAYAVLAPGTQIGRGVVVGIGSVVHGTVSPRSIVRGNPAVVIGQR